jgi:hypothetical protein
MVVAVDGDRIVAAGEAVDPRLSEPLRRADVRMGHVASRPDPSRGYFDDPRARLRRRNRAHRAGSPGHERRVGSHGPSGSGGDLRTLLR